MPGDSSTFNLPNTIIFNANKSDTINFPIPLTPTGDSKQNKTTTSPSRGGPLPECSAPRWDEWVCTRAVSLGVCCGLLVKESLDCRFRGLYTGEFWGVKNVRCTCSIHSFYPEISLLFQVRGLFRKLFMSPQVLTLLA